MEKKREEEQEKREKEKESMNSNGCGGCDECSDAGFEARMKRFFHYDSKGNLLSSLT